MKMKPDILYISGKKNRRIKLGCAQRGAIYWLIFHFKQQGFWVESRVSQNNQNPLYAQGEIGAMVNQRGVGSELSFSMWGCICAL